MNLNEASLSGQCLKSVREEGAKLEANQLGRLALEGLRVSPKPAASRKINIQIISHPVTYASCTQEEVR